jgi:lipoprotein-anchoring transpeptidase ErfK/SrfK
MSRLARTMRWVLLLLALAAALAAATAHAQDVTTTTTTTDSTTTAEAPPPVIADGVTIAGVPVGGLTAEEATAAVRAFFARPFTFHFRTFTWQAGPGRVGASANVAAAVTAALAAAPAEALALPVTVNALTLRAYVVRIARRYKLPAVNSRVFLTGLRPYVTRARRGLAVRQQDTRFLIRALLAAHERGPATLPSRVLYPRVTRANFGPVIVIRRGSHRLFLYRVMTYWRNFGVAVGMPQYPTPLGHFRIVVKQRNPWWYPPDSAWAAGASPIPPGPGNPLGTRWMGLSAWGVGIHGTPDAASIGYSASHGCIRMRIADAEWLFERVRIGTPVFIVSA